MTAAELARLLLRRWYLTVLGAVGSLAVLWMALHQPPVYFTQLDVVLLPPAELTPTNTLREGPYALAPLAGLIVVDVNQGVQPTQLGSATTTLYGEGLREGERVRLRNRGTQWKGIYDVPVIDVQVVARDPDVVQARTLELVAELDQALAARQVEAGVPPRGRVSVASSPADPVLQQIGASRSRAVGAIAVLGAVLTFIVVVALDRLLARRRSSPDDAPRAGQTTPPLRAGAQREVVTS